MHHVQCLMDAICNHHHHFDDIKNIFGVRYFYVELSELKSLSYTALYAALE